MSGRITSSSRATLLRTGRDWKRDLPWVDFANVADRWPEFQWIAENVPVQRLGGSQPLITSDPWILVLPQLRREPSVRKVLDWIAEVADKETKGLHGA